MQERRTLGQSLTIPTEAVDLGLPSGLLWSSGNLALDSGGNYYIGNYNEYGCYCSFGDIIAHNNREYYSFSQENYDNGVSGDGHNLTTTRSFSGNPLYDIARARLGSLWRIPEPKEWQELRLNSTINGSLDENNQLIVTVTGPNGNFIYFPLTGYFPKSSSIITRDGKQGYYWSSTFHPANGGVDYELQSLAFWRIESGYADRCMGLAIRPVFSLL